MNAAIMTHLKTMTGADSFVVVASSGFVDSSSDDTGDLCDSMIAKGGE